MKRPAFRFAESSLDRFLSAHLSNSQYNRFVWGVYPHLWRLGSLAGVRTSREADPDDVLGQEWGTRASLGEILERFFFPYLEANSIVGEIGVGGGRIASQVAPQVGRFYGLDVSEGMLRKAKARLAENGNARFIKLKHPSCPLELRGELDFVYAFDVLVHFDLHTTWKYICLMRDMLKPGGKALVHVASLGSPRGWESFARQRGFSVGGLYWLCPQVVAIMAENAGFAVVADSTPDPDNEYLDRDYIAILEKFRPSSPGLRDAAPVE